MNAYFISGLGADKRIFSRLKLDESIHIINVEWIEPLKNESLPAYAIRLSKVMDTTRPFALVGVSFGGMIAVEIAKVLNPTVTIIISSTLKASQLPATYRFAGKLDILKFIPAQWLKSSNKLTQNYYFGTKTSSEKVLLGKIVQDTDPDFLKWAIGSILNWKNETRPENLYHIHGTNDKILYSKKAKPDFVIDGGTHFMVYQHAAEISDLISNLTLKISNQ